MKRHSPLLLALSLVSLIGCSSQAPDKVAQINTLHIPLVLSGEKSAQPVTALFNANKQDIDQLTLTLKKTYLQDAKAKEIFSPDSDIQPVYTSLSKLEELSMVNQQYLKDKNARGLQQIHAVLQPIING
ncbi:hypothetical protein D3C75_653310 [compost metagenome]